VSGVLSATVNMRVAPHNTCAHSAHCSKPREHLTHHPIQEAAGLGSAVAALDQRTHTAGSLGAAALCLCCHTTQPFNMETDPWQGLLLCTRSTPMCQHTHNYQWAHKAKPGCSYATAVQQRPRHCFSSFQRKLLLLTTPAATWTTTATHSATAQPCLTASYGCLSSGWHSSYRCV
jgi:hypothetical protein